VRYLPHACEDMVRAVLGEHPIVRYLAKYREYGLPYPDGHTYQLLRFCPWCGTRLPDSLGEEWFDRIEELGMEPEDERLPASMRSDEWWREDGGPVVVIPTPYDRVRTLVDVETAHHGRLEAGATGTIVDILHAPNEYAIDFALPAPALVGVHAHESVPLPPEQFVVIDEYRPREHDRVRSLVGIGKLPPGTEGHIVEISEGQNEYSIDLDVPEEEDEQPDENVALPPDKFVVIEAS
jgi:hypothetical protein